MLASYADLILSCANVLGKANFSKMEESSIVRTRESCEGQCSSNSCPYC